MGALSSAYGYAQDLNKSLTDIRIVTGYSTDQMADFAEQANKAAKALSTTTTEYTNASLIYYQQGLSDQEVADRTDITIKMANAAGVSAQTVSDQLTAVWNNFYDGSKSLEYYADVMVRLGADTASSTDEISDGLNKFAAVAETVGLSYEYAASALATITATTRQSADVVGTALKTLFARIQDLELGNTLDDGTTLGTYSQALEKVGINIKNQNGDLKEMDQILNEMGAKWTTLSKDQQVALAEAVAGVRQYTQLVALMDNWDYFQENLNSAYGASGSLDEQAEIYADSWEAASNRVRAAAEAIYSDLLNDEFFIDLNNGLSGLLTLLDNVIDGVGGLQGVLLALGTVGARVFRNQLAEGIQNVGYSLRNLTKSGRERNESLRSEANNELITMFTGSATDSGSVIGAAYASQGEVQNAYLQNVSRMTESQRTIAQILLQQHNTLVQNAVKQGEIADESERQMNAEIRKAQSQVDSSNKTQNVKVRGRMREYALATEDISKLESVMDRLFDGSLINSKPIDQQVKNLQKSFNNLNTYVNKTFKSNGGLLSIFSDMEAQAPEAFKEVQQSYEQLTQALQTQDLSSLTQEDLDQLAINFARAIDHAKAELQAKVDGEDWSNTFEGVTKAAEKAGSDIGNAISQGAKIGTDEAGKNLSKLPGSISSAATKIVDVTESIMGISSALTMTTSAINALSDDSLTAGEKAMQAFSGIGTAITMVGTLASGTAGKQLAAALSAGKWSAANITLAASFGILLGAVAAITLAIVAIKAAMDAAYANSPEGKLEAATLNAQALSKALDDAKTSAENLQNTFNTYDDAINTLDECVKGTNEWTKSLIEANDAALELIRNYPELSTMINANGEAAVTRNADGLIEVADWAQEWATEEANRRVINAYGADAMGQALVREAQINVDRTNLRDSLGYIISDDTTVQTDNNIANAIANNIDDFIGLTDNELASKLEPIIAKASANGEATQDQIQNWIDKINGLQGDMVDLSNAIKENSAMTKLESQAVADAILKDTNFTNTDAGEMAAERGGEIYNQLQQAAMEQYKKVDVADWLGTRTKEGKQLFSDYAAEKGIDQLEGYQVENYLTNNGVKYSYIDDSGERKTVEVTQEQIAATLASRDATNQLIDALSALRSTIESLESTGKAEDSALASFLSEGDLESATKSEFEALQNRVASEGVDSVLGLTGDATADNKLAQSRGYTDATAYRKAFESALQIDWSSVSAGLPEALQYTADLTLTQATKVTDIYNRTLRLGGQEAATAYSDMINSVMGAVKPEDQEKVMSILTNVDWSSWDAVDQIADNMSDLGYEIDTTSESWRNFANGMREAYRSVPDLNSLAETLNSIKDISSEIKLRSIISKDDYNTLVNFNNELSKYFTILADGTARMTGDPLDFAQEVKESQQKAWADAAQQYLTQAEDLSRLESGTGLNDNDKAAIQLQYLDAAGQDISEYQQMYSDGNGEEAVTAITEAFNQLGLSAEDATAKAQSAMTELAFSAESAKERLSMLENGDINTSAYNAAALSAINEDQWEGMNVDEVQSYADHLQEVAEKSDILSDELKDNEEAAEDVALATKRMNQGIETLADGIDDWSDVLQNSDEASEEYADAMTGIKDAMSDVLGVSSEFLSDDFILQNMSDIEAAANGDAEAIDRLAIAAGKDILINLDFQDEGVQAEVLGLYDQLVQAIPGDLQIGATLDDGDFIDIANQIVQTAGMTAEQANALFSTMGFQANFKTEPQEVVQRIPIVHTRQTIVDSGKDENGARYWETTTETWNDGYKEQKGEVDAIAMTTSPDGSEVPIIESVTSTRSGAMNDYSSSNTGGVATPKSSGGGGGGSSAKKAEDADKDDIVDRYKEIDDAIDDMSDAINDASKAADRLYGRSRIDAMKQQNNLIQQEIGLLKQKKTEAQANLAIDQQALNAAASEAGVSFTYDENGNISNYTTTMTNLYNQLQGMIDAANADGNATDEEQEAIDALQELIDKLIDAIGQYDDTRELIEDLDNEITDKFYEWQDNNYEILHYELEIEIELSDLDLEYIDYYLNKITDDFYAMAEAASLMTQQIPEYVDQLGSYEDFYNNITAAYNAGEISQADYVEGMKESYSAILDQLTALNDLDKEMLHYYEDTLSAASDELSYYTDQMEHLTSVLDHYQSIVELINGEYDYDRIGTILQGQAQTLKNELDVSTANYEMLLSELAEVQQSLANATDEAARELYQEELEAITTAVNEAHEDMLSKTEEWLEAQKAIMENAMAEAAQSMEDAFTDNMGFDALNDSLDRLNSYADEYLTKTNQIYETQKLMNTAQQAADKTTNQAAKQRLQNFIEETQELQEKTQLSNLELEIQKAKYDLLLAEIALEEAQNVKSTVRIRRNDEGNYGYVYTADQEEISQAEADLLDAQNALYNIGLEGTNEYGQKILELQQQLADDLIALEQARAEGQYATDAEYYAARDQLIAEYTDLFTAYSEQYTTALGVDAAIQEEAWINAYQNMIQQTVDWGDVVQDYTGQCEDAFSSWKDTVESESSVVDEILNDTEQEVKDVTEASDDLRDEIANDVIPAIKNQLVSVRDVTSAYAQQRSAIQELIAYYEQLAQAIRQAIQAQAEMAAQQASQSKDDSFWNQDFSDLMDKAAAADDWAAYEEYKHYREQKEQLGYYNGGVDTGTLDKFFQAGGALNGSYVGDVVWDYLEKHNQTYATGGYTGNFGPDMRLAGLHEKELVLNEDDTTNFLTATSLLRDIVNTIDLSAISSQLNSRFSSNFFNAMGGGILEQQVSIEATFPNVTDHREIEEALGNLINTASQFANRKNI